MLEKMVNFKLLTLKRSDLIKKFVEFQGYLIEGLQYFIENGHLSKNSILFLFTPI